MVNSKRVMIVGILILLLIVSLQFSFAAKGGDKGGDDDNEILGGSSGTVCTIGTIDKCDSLGYINVLGLSYYSNAHGDLITEANIENYGDGETDYGYALCCSFDSPVLPAAACNNGRKIIGLSAASNAHGEIPTSISDIEYSPSYTSFDVCYDDQNFNCEEAEPGQTCGTLGKTEILSLSDYGNAHIGEPGTYDKQICCNVEFQSGTFCGDGVVQSPNDEIPEIEEQCDTGVNCLMKEDYMCQCYYGYGENPFPNSIGCILIAAGEVHWSEDEEEGLELLEQSVIIGQTFVYLVALDVGMAENDGTLVDFEIWEDDLFNDDYITTLSSTFTSGRAFINWNISLENIEDARQGGEEDDFKFYFKALYNNGNPNYETDDSNDLEVTITESPICETKSRCMDYTNQISCESDEFTCQLADNSVEGVDCSNPEIDCECSWDETSDVCGPAWSVDNYGSCIYEEITNDNCDDMLLTYRWTGEWSGSRDGDLDELCIEEEQSSTVPCPAQIQLEFFSYSNFLVIIILIIIIYVWTNSRKKPKKRKKRK
jgi:hypothetical protein